MKNNQKSTDLLQQAKTTEPNLLSGNELSEIMETGKHLGTKQTKIIKGRLVMSITSILAVAATAAYLALAPVQEQKNIDNQVINNVPKTEQVETTIQDKTSEIIAKEETEDFASAETDYQEIPTEESSFKINTEKVNIDGINIISINSKQDLEELGIYKDGNEFSFPAFRNKEDNVKSTILLTLKKENGSNTIDYAVRSDKEYIAKFSPQLITDGEGKKEMSMFDTGNMKMMTRSEYVATDENGKKSLNIDLNTIQDTQPKKFSEPMMYTLQKMMSGKEPDSTDKEFYKMVSSLKEGEELDLSFVFEDIVRKQLREQKFPTVDPSTLSQESLASLDSIIDTQLKNLPKFDMKIGRGENNNSYLEYGIDSLASDTSSIRINFSNIEIYTKDKNVAEEEYGQDDLNKFIDDINNSLNDSTLKELTTFDDSRLNKMLAIAIKLDEASDKPDFILWYDISQELIEALPLEYREKLGTELSAISEGDFCSGSSLAGEDTYCDVWRACNGGLKEMSIYPVPIKNDFTVEYDLSEDRKLDFVIHDLYGKEVISLKSGVKRAQGHQTEQFNIDLPPGMYLLSITSNQGEHTVQRLVVE